jgi:CDGSH-type Zn-finger protein
MFMPVDINSHPIKEASSDRVQSRRHLPRAQGPCRQSQALLPRIAGRTEDQVVRLRPVKRQPFCDSVSHEGTGFEPIEYVAKEAEEVLLCGCKQTKTGPFCDGEHSNLPGGYVDEEEPQNTTLVEADAQGFAHLNTPCYVVSPPDMGSDLHWRVWSRPIPGRSISRNST